MGDEEDEEEIPLPNVSSVILQKIIQWVTHLLENNEHEEDAIENNENKDEAISTWDTDFLNVDQKTLCDLILAANYLDIPELLDLGIRTVANRIRGKTTQDIRDMFKIKKENMFTEDIERYS